MNEREYLTMDEAAEQLGWNRATVFTWAKRLGVKTHRFIGSRKTYLAAGDVERIRVAHEKPWLAGEKEPEGAVA